MSTEEDKKKPPGTGQTAPSGRFRGLVPYVMSLLLIVVPAVIFYYLYTQSQTRYHEARAFRSLHEIGRIADAHLDSLANLNQTVSAFQNRFESLLEGRDSARKDLTAEAELTATEVQTIEETLRWLKELKEGEGDPAGNAGSDAGDAVQSRVSDQLDLKTKQKHLKTLQLQSDKIAATQAAQDQLTDELAFVQIAPQDFFVSPLREYARQFDPDSLEAAFWYPDRCNQEEPQPLDAKAAYLSRIAFCFAVLADDLEEYFHASSAAERKMELLNKIAQISGTITLIGRQPPEPQGGAAIDLENQAYRKDETSFAAESEVKEAAGLAIDAGEFFAGEDWANYRQDHDEEIVDLTGAVEVAATRLAGLKANNLTIAGDINTTKAAIAEIEARVNSRGLDSDNGDSPTEEAPGLSKDELEQLDEAIGIYEGFLVAAKVEQEFADTLLDTIRRVPEFDLEETQTDMTRNFIQVNPLFTQLQMVAIDELQLQRCTSGSSGTIVVGSSRQSAHFGYPTCLTDRDREHHQYRVPVKDLLADIRRQREFDILLIADPSGRVIYGTEAKRRMDRGDDAVREAIARTLHFKYATALLNRVAREFARTGDKPDGDNPVATDLPAAPLNQPGFTDFTIGSLSYKVFIQPWRPDRLLFDGQPDRVWSIVGLVDDNRFRDQVINLPPSTVAVVIIVFLIVLLLTPYLKVGLAGPLSSWSRTFLLLMGIGGFLSASLAVILVLHLTFGYAFTNMFKSTANVIARDMVRDIEVELGDLTRNFNLMTGQLLDDGHIDKPDVARSASTSAEPRLLPRRMLLPRAGSYRPREMVSALTQAMQGQPFVQYARHMTSSGLPPPFQSLLLFDDNGIQCGPYISYRDYFLDRIDVSGRNYFQRARRYETPDNRIPMLQPASIERIANYSDGTRMTATGFNISRSTKAAVTFYRPKKDKIDATCEVSVGVIYTPLKAFASPVLPAGFHFTVIDDRTGRVIAGDESDRVLIEDFFQEADEALKLLAAVRDRRENRWSGLYHGAWVNFHTMPVGSVPWTVVIRFDQSFVQTVHLEVMLAAIGTVLVAALIIGLNILLTGFWKRRRWSWVWLPRPDPVVTARTLFWLPMLLLTLIAGFGVAVVLTVTGLVMFGAVLLLVHAGMFVIYQCAGQPRVIRSLGHRSLFNSNVALMVVLWLAVLFGNFDHGEQFLARLILLGVLLLTFGLIRLPGWLKKLERDDADRCGRPGYKAPSVEARKARYVAVGTLAVLVIAGLPAMAGYREAFSVFGDRLTRYSELQMAQSYLRNQAARESYIRSLLNPLVRPADVPAESRFIAGEDVKPNLEGIYTYKDILLPARQEGFPQRENLFLPPGEQVICDRNTSPLSDQVRSIRFEGMAAFVTTWMVPVNDLDARMALAGFDGSSDGGWCWSTDDSETLFVWPEKEIRISAAPNFSPEGQTYLWLALLAVIWGVAVHRVVLISTRRIAAADITESIFHPVPKAPTEPGRADARCLVLRPKAAVLKAYRKGLDTKKSGLKELDVAHLPEDFSKRFVNPYLKAKHVVVTGMSSLICDPERRRNALEVLEQITRKNLNGKITIFMEIGLLYRVIRPEAYRDHTDTDNSIGRPEAMRWSGIFNEFVKGYDWPPVTTDGQREWYAWQKQEDPVDQAMSRECRIFPDDLKVEKHVQDQATQMRGTTVVTVEHVISLASYFGGAYYRTLWSQCTHAERVYLHLLASGRAVNTSNIEVLGHLLRRGLVSLEPELTITTDGFAAFIREAETAQTFHAWEREEEAKSAWAVMRIPFIVLIIVAGGFLLSTAQEEIEAILAVMAGALTAVPILLRGAGIVRGVTDGR